MVRRSSVLEFLFILLTSWSPAWILFCGQRRYAKKEYEKEDQPGKLTVSQGIFLAMEDEENFNDYIWAIVLYLIAYVSFGLWIDQGADEGSLLIVGWVVPWIIGFILQVALSTRRPKFDQDYFGEMDRRISVFELGPTDKDGKRRQRRFSTILNTTRKPRPISRESIVQGAMLGVYRDNQRADKIRKYIKKLKMRAPSQKLQRRITNLNELVQEEEKLEKRKRKSKNQSEIRDLQRRMTVVQKQMSDYISDDEDLDEFDDAIAGQPKPKQKQKLKFII